MTHKKQETGPLRRTVVGAVFDFFFEPPTSRTLAETRYRHQLSHRPVW